MGNTLPDYAGPIAEWLHNPENQQKFIKDLTVKGRFLTEQLIDVLELVLDANFDPKRIPREIPADFLEIASVMKWVQGFTPGRKITED